MKKLVLFFSTILCFGLLTNPLSAQEGVPSDVWTPKLIEAVQEAKQEIKSRTVQPSGDFQRPPADDPTVVGWGKLVLLTEEYPDISSIAVRLWERAGFTIIAPEAGLDASAHYRFFAVKVGIVYKTTLANKDGSLPKRQPLVAPFCQKNETDGNFNVRGFGPGDWVHTPGFNELVDLLIEFSEYMKLTWGEGLPAHQLPYQCPVTQEGPDTWGAEVAETMAILPIAGQRTHTPTPTRTITPEGTNTPGPSPTATATATAQPGSTATPTQAPTAVPPEKKPWAPGGKAAIWFIPILTVFLVAILGLLAGEYSTKGFTDILIAILIGIISIIAFEWTVSLMRYYGVLEPFWRS